MRRQRDEGATREGVQHTGEVGYNGRVGRAAGGDRRGARRATAAGPLRTAGAAVNPDAAADEARAAGEPDVIAQVNAARAGDNAAFAGLYDRYVNVVYGYIYHRVGQQQTAEDLVGDVFLRALRRLPNFRWQGVDFGAWLITIARNRVNDHFKSARFRLESSVDQIFDSPSHDRFGDPEGVALATERARAVHAGLGRLKDEQAEVLYLRFIQHLGVAETASVMGRTDGAVKALQYRALKSLGRVLPEEIQLR